jgi:cell filamentation protein
LQAIHQRIFGDVYEWAGVIRPFALTKGGDEFCRPHYIESSAADIFGRLHDADRLHGLDVETFAAQAAELLADLNALHPFREGNGRTQRAFLSQLAGQAGYRLIWPSGAGQEERNVDASRASHRGDASGLAAIIRDAIALAEPAIESPSPSQLP